MPKLPRISSKQAIRTLERLGFKQVRQTGSHVVVRKGIKEATIGCTVNFLVGSVKLRRA